MEKDRCVCNHGNRIINGSCSDYFFNLTISISQSNKIKLYFSEVPLNFSSEILKLSIDSIEFSSNFFIINQNSFYITIDTKDSIPQNTACKIIIIETVLYSTKGAKLDKYIYSTALNYQEYLNPDLLPVVEKQKAVV